MSSDIVIVVDNRQVKELADEHIADAARGVYGRMRHDHLKKHNTRYYDKLVTEGRLERECAQAQFSIDRYVKGAVELFIKDDFNYHMAEIRNDSWAKFSLVEAHRSFAEQYAIRLFVECIYTD
jgi:ribosome biogenesis SPOUT family RNA methylase Rps3